LQRGLFCLCRWVGGARADGGVCMNKLERAGEVYVSVLLAGMVLLMWYSLPRAFSLLRRPHGKFYWHSRGGGCMRTAVTLRCSLIFCIFTRGASWRVGIALGSSAATFFSSAVATSCLHLPSARSAATNCVTGICMCRNSAFSGRRLRAWWKNASGRRSPLGQRGGNGCVVAWRSAG